MPTDQPARASGSRGMCTEGMRAELRRMLSAALRALALGNYRAVLDPTSSPGGVGLTGGPEDLVHLGSVLLMLAHSMVLQVRGDVHDAWDRLSDAAGALPAGLGASTAEGTVLAQLGPDRSDASLEECLWRLTAQLIWRDQNELRDVRRRFRPGLMSPREQLIEACIERFFWISLNPHFWVAATGGTGSAESADVDLLLAVDVAWAAPSRMALCRRGSRLRQFADPQAGDISQSVWRDIGGYHGLCVAALEALAQRSRPVPWCEVSGAADIPIRLGRLRAWEHARSRLDDLDPGDTPSEMRGWRGYAGPCPSDLLGCAS